MFSNYNIITIPIEMDGKYRIGDVFHVDKTVTDWRIWKFDGLEIKNIDYCWGVRLHFDWDAWHKNSIPKNIDSGPKITFRVL